MTTSLRTPVLERLSWCDPRSGADVSMLSAQWDRVVCAHHVWQGSLASQQPSCCAREVVGRGRACRLCVCQCDL